MNRKSGYLQTICVLLIFTLFTGCSLLLVLTGARVFKNISSQSEYNSQLRSTLGYTANKLRSYDQPGKIQVTNIDGLPVLRLSESIDSQTFFTYLYWYDGNLKELFVNTDEKFNPQNGETISKIKDFTVKKSNNRILLSATATNGQHADLTVSIRSMQRRD